MSTTTKGRKTSTGNKRSVKKSSRKPKVKLSLKSVAVLSLSIVAGCALVLAGGTLYSRMAAGETLFGQTKTGSVVQEGISSYITVEPGVEEKGSSSGEKVSYVDSSSNKSNKKTESGKAGENDSAGNEIDVKDAAVSGTVPEVEAVAAEISGGDFLSEYDVSNVVVAGKGDGGRTDAVVYGGGDFDSASLISSIDAALSFENGSSGTQGTALSANRTSVGGATGASSTKQTSQTTGTAPASASTKQTQTAGTAPSSASTKQTQTAGTASASASTKQTQITGTAPSSTKQTSQTAGTAPASTSTKQTQTTGTTPASASTKQTQTTGTAPASTTKQTQTTGTAPASASTKQTQTTGTASASASTKQTQTTGTASASTSTKQTSQTTGTAPSVTSPSASKSTGGATSTKPSTTSTASVASSQSAVDITKCPYDIPTAAKGATLVFVIDDAGQTLDNVRRYTSLPFPLTIAVLPKLAHTKDAARIISASGKEMILHQPMQASNLSIKPGPGAITPDMSVQEIQMMVWENLEELGPNVRGLNNHEGSLITENMVKIQCVLEVAQNRGVYFLDSKTTAKTVVPQAAMELGMKVCQRDVFIDDIINREEMLKQIYRGLSIANKNGKVIMIGHVDKSVNILPALLQDMYPYLVAKGYKFATPSTM